jgi:hypothetical protein
MHIDNPFAMVVMIVLIVSVASVLRAKFGYQRRRDRERSGFVPANDGETRALRDEVTRLRDRLEVLERITIEKENSLAREIENLRDR